jgi:galactokinase
MSSLSPQLEVLKFFKRIFAFTPPHIVQAPGRLELLGNHTDYNEGLVMSLAIDRHLFIACAPRTDGRIELVSTAYPGREKFSMSEFKKNPAAPWADYVKGVLEQFRKRDIHFSGFSAAIHSTIPAGAGMGSSAALTVATTLAIRRLYPFKLARSGAPASPDRNRKRQVEPPTPQEKMHLAKICQAAENKFVGVNCGLLDQISSLFGREFHAMEIDCRFLTVEHVPLIGPVSVVLCDSGVKHVLANGEYNARRRHCEAAARALGAKSLRSVDPKLLAAMRARLSQREYECAYHVVGEIQRVVFGERALREGDLNQFGQYMFQSHESSRDFFRNSCPELDLLVDLARRQPGCLGARLTGGGFGGATIQLVLQSDVENFMRAMAQQYEASTGRKMQPVLCRVMNGAA